MSSLRRLASSAWSGARDRVAGLAGARPTAAPTDELCRCGHVREAHEHYRPGSDCGLCDCPRFRR